MHNTHSQRLSAPASPYPAPSLPFTSGGRWERRRYYLGTDNMRKICSIVAAVVVTSTLSRLLWQFRSMSMIISHGIDMERRSGLGDPRALSLQSTNNSIHISTRSKILVFYNLFVAGAEDVERVQDIFDEQLTELDPRL